MKRSASCSVPVHGRSHTVPFQACARYALTAAISVGDNPTFEGVAKKQVEAYVLDRELDLYDHLVEVEFVERLRGMVAFTSIADLIDQMHDDVERAREILVD